MKTKILLTIMLLFVLGVRAEENKIIVPELRSSTGAILLTNAEYRSVIGRRVTFRTADGTPKAFDVLQLSETNRAELKISAGDAIASQEEIEAKRKAYLEKAVIAAAQRQQAEIDAGLKFQAQREESAKQAKKDQALAEAKYKQEQREELERRQAESEIDLNKAKAQYLRTP